MYGNKKAGMPVVLFSKKLTAASDVTLCVKFLSGCDRPGTGPNKTDILQDAFKKWEKLLLWKSMQM